MDRIAARDRASGLDRRLFHTMKDCAAGSLALPGQNNVRLGLALSLRYGKGTASPVGQAFVGAWDPFLCALRLDLGLDQGHGSASLDMASQRHSSLK